MTHADYALTALCLWREARGEGAQGMTAVACVIQNRVHRDSSSYFDEVARKLQFSSMTAPGDRQLTLYPKSGDASWIEAQAVAADVIDGKTSDPTQGATLYYDDSISFPASWNPAMVQATVKIGRLNFFKELSR